AASVSQEEATTLWLRRSGTEIGFIALAALLSTLAAAMIARTIARANARQALATAELAARERRLIELGRENARLVAALQASPAAIMITDPNQPNNPIIYVNDAFERLTGYRREDALGRDPGFLNAASTERNAISTLRNAVANAMPATVELINQRQDGSLWWNHVAMSPVVGDGGRIHAVVYVKSDLSDHKRYEAELTIAKVQAELANKAKSEFIAVTGHELRAPLNAILGFADLLRKEALGPLGHADYAVYAGDMHDSAGHLLALINDLLDLSKVESGRMEIEDEPVDLNDAVEGAMVMVRQRASETGVKLETSLDPDLPPIRGDARRLKQVALNLLTNAVKFTPAHGVVRVGTQVESDAVVLVVQDTGVGIAPDEIEKALEPYGQARNRIGGRETGTGLGLPLCKKLAELHGGSLRLDSTLGEGTTVTVTLPREAAAAAA
ncbi:MAG: ATP-binding protein, partial [Pseudomonadota bacterium]